MKLKNLLGTITLSIVVVTLRLPLPALACAVCSAREDAQRDAFIATTVFLSVLPVGLVFGVAWWLRKQLRRKNSLRSIGRERIRVSR